MRGGAGAVWTETMRAFLLFSASDYVCVLDIDLLELVIKTWKGSTEGRLVSVRPPGVGRIVTVTVCPYLAGLPLVLLQGRVMSL